MLTCHTTLVSRMLAVPLPLSTSPNSKYDTLVHSLDMVPGQALLFYAGVF